MLPSVSVPSVTAANPIEAATAEPADEPHCTTTALAEQGRRRDSGDTYRVSVREICVRALAAAAGPPRGEVPSEVCKL